MTLCFHQPWCHIHHTKALSTLLWSPRTFSPLPYNKKYIYNQALICGVSLLVNLFTTISSWSFCLLLCFAHCQCILTTHLLWFFHHIVSTIFSGLFPLAYTLVVIMHCIQSFPVLMGVTLWSWMLNLSLHTGTFCYSLGFDRQLCFRQMRPLCHD